MKMKPITPPAKIGPYKLNYDTVDTSSIQDQIFFTIFKEWDVKFVKDYNIFCSKTHTNLPIINDFKSFNWLYFEFYLTFI